MANNVGYAQLCDWRPLCCHCLPVIKLVGIMTTQFSVVIWLYMLTIRILCLYIAWMCHTSHKINIHWGFCCIYFSTAPIYPYHTGLLPWYWTNIRLSQCKWRNHQKYIIFSCDQAALWMVQSVPPSVRPSARVCPSVTPFWLCSHHRIIMKFSGVITSDRSDIHAKGQSQRSKVKVTEVTTQLYRFRTVTPVWIHIWWWNDAYSLIMLRRGALLFFKVIHQISRSHGFKNRLIWPRLGVSGL